MDIFRVRTGVGDFADYIPSFLPILDLQIGTFIGGQSCFEPRMARRAYTNRERLAGMNHVAP